MVYERGYCLILRCGAHILLYGDKSPTFISFSIGFSKRSSLLLFLHRCLSRPRSGDRPGQVECVHRGRSGEVLVPKCRKSVHSKLIWEIIYLYSTGHLIKMSLLELVYSNFAYFSRSISMTHASVYDNPTR